MSFVETFGAVFVAQSMALFCGWIFKTFFEPKLNLGHKHLRKIVRKVKR